MLVLDAAVAQVELAQKIAARIPQLALRDSF